MSTLLMVAAALGGFGWYKARQLEQGRIRTAQEAAATRIKPIGDFGAVKELSILPLIDYYAAEPGLATEAGVAYLIEADGQRILMDTGLNQKKEHPSPLVRNMQRLGIAPASLDMLFFSHLHLDHVGGRREEKRGEFSLSQGPVELGAIAAFATQPLKPSSFNPGPKPETVSGPQVLAPGIASIGPQPRFLFGLGYTAEHSLAVNVAGKGIVLIIGCGHQTVEKIIERAQALFNEPIYAIVGGLHLPIRGGRIMAGPLNLQKIVGSDQPPWKGLSEKDVDAAIAAVRAAAPAVVALSAHDSSDWVLARFSAELGEVCRDLKVGQRITI